MIEIGVEFGNRQRPSAICVASGSQRTVNGHQEHHFTVRTLKRLDVGTTFPMLAEQVASVEVGVRQKAPAEEVMVWVNATAHGEPLVEMICSRTTSRVRPVYFTHGDRRSENGLKVELGKALLVSRLQMLLQTGRVHLPKTAQAEILAKELLDYEVKIDEKANERYGAFRVGTQDDLVTALGLAVHCEPRFFQIL